MALASADVTPPVPVELTPRIVEQWRAGLAEPDERGCRLWTVTLDVNGYGRLNIRDEGGRRRTVGAHDIAWLIEVGPYPPGLEPDHTCVRPACTTVAHMEWVTHAENQRRIAERSTHCRAGLHRWDGQEPIVRARGGRECRPCENDAQRRRRATRSGRNGVVGRPPRLRSG